jgi:hypothetical protein
MKKVHQMVTAALQRAMFSARLLAVQQEVRFLNFDVV